MKVVNFPAHKYDLLEGGWPDVYFNLWKAFHELGWEIRISPWFCSYNNGVQEHVYIERKIRDTILPEYVNVGITDNPNHLYIFNHIHKYGIRKNNNPKGNYNLFIKPSGPGADHFTIDELGYAAHSSITYKKPNYESTPYIDFFNNTLPHWINDKINKWDTDNNVQEFSKPSVELPENHILFVGQMPGDETCSIFSFGDHWHKFKTLVEVLETDDHVVIKLHPYMKHENAKAWAESDMIQLDNVIKHWESLGHIVLQGFESIHDVLPKSKVAIIECSSAGIECLMHNVPIISYGYPEYHWVTKDLRHAINLTKYTKDLSWYNEHEAKSWMAWYATDYLCTDFKSTLHRLKQLI